MKEIGKQYSEESSEEIQICNEELTPSALKTKGGDSRVERTVSLNEAVAALAGTSRASERHSQDNKLLINFPFPRRILASGCF